MSSAAPVLCVSCDLFRSSQITCFLLSFLVLSGLQLNIKPHLKMLFFLYAYQGLISISTETRQLNSFSNKQSISRPKTSHASTQLADFIFHVTNFSNYKLRWLSQVLDWNHYRNKEVHTQINVFWKKIFFSVDCTFKTWAAHRTV